MSAVTEELAIDLEENRYLLYAPLRKSAFVGNAEVVNLISDLLEGIHEPTPPESGALLALLRRSSSSMRVRSTLRRRPSAESRSSSS
jgi:hypothetical protein